jgi:hypothetical protein
MTQMRWIVASQLVLCAMQAWFFVVHGGWGFISNVIALAMTLWAWRRMRKIESEHR